MKVQRAWCAAALMLVTLSMSAACTTNNPASTPNSSEPAASGAPSSILSGAKVFVTLTPAGCTPTPASVPAGSVSFTVTNQDASGVSELELKQGDTVIAEKENLTPGLIGTFSAQLQPGTYILECPGATTDEAQLTVTN